MDLLYWLAMVKGMEYTAASMFQRSMLDVEEYLEAPDWADDSDKLVTTALIQRGRKWEFNINKERPCPKKEWETASKNRAKINYDSQSEA